MNKTIRVAISGSGTRYPVQIGALCELTDMGYDIVEAVVTSGGAVAGACKARFQTSKRMTEAACDLLPREHLDFRVWPFGGVNGGIAGKKLRRAFARHLGARIEQLQGPRLHIVTGHWATGEARVWTQGDLPLALSASMCLPIFDMVEIDGEFYEDGGACGANFLLDYRGWQDRSGDPPLLGLKVRGVGEAVPRRRPKTKIDRLMGTVENLIAACDREHIEDAHWAKVVMLDTKAPGLDLLMGPDQVMAMIEEGRQAVRLAHLEGKLG